MLRAQVDWLSKLLSAVISTASGGGQTRSAHSRDLPLDPQQQHDDLLSALRAEHEVVTRQAWLWPHTQSYNREIIALVEHAPPQPNYFFHGSWELGTPFGDKLNLCLHNLAMEFEESLIEGLRDSGIEGCIVEFGVYEGATLKRLIEAAEKAGITRKFYGFDSFEGLSAPSPEFDYDSWKEGQYSAGYEVAARNLRLSERPHLTLVKGWLQDSLRDPEVRKITDIAYARVDVDIYQPTVECLDFLANRMANGAILVFDDWAYTTEKGESRAFLEWVPKVPWYRFEHLAQCASRFYIKVHHR